MDLDEVILVIDAQMPIRARRVKYFEDPVLKVLHASQSGSFPYPDEDGLRRDRQMSETRETVERLKQELLEVRAANVLPNAVSKSTNERSKTDLSSSARSRGRDTRIGAIAGQGRLSLDIDGLKIDSTHDAALASAVQTTKSILKEHG